MSILPLAAILFASACLTMAWEAITPDMTFQWQLQGTIDLSINADVYDIDLFDAQDSDIATLKNNGRVVICYFSAGSLENWRSDVGSVNPSAIGNPLDGWAGEKWWDIRDSSVRNVILGRLDLAQSRGCDGVEPDNVDAYSPWNNDGLGITEADQLDFNKWLAREAHKRCLSVGLKNTVELISQLEPYFDWALNEECLDYNECGGYSAFLNHDKAVFHVEYANNTIYGQAKQSAVCSNGVLYIPEHSGPCTRIGDVITRVVRKPYVRERPPCVIFDVGVQSINAVCFTCKRPCRDVFVLFCVSKRVFKQ